MIINGNLSWERFIKAAVQANSSACEPFKHCCNSTGEVCELATEFGYCKVTACTKRYGDSPPKEEAARAQPRWIPAAERLPEKRKWVLCRCEADIIEVLRWENNEWYHDPMHVYYPSFVTHWMPLPSTDGLPQPPKEET